MSDDNFPRKRLLVRPDTLNSELNEVFAADLEALKARIRGYKTNLQNGFLDAPDMTKMVYLGKINESNPEIFKVNVPGWIYRFAPTWSTVKTADDYGSAYAKGYTGILLSYDPNYLKDNSNDAKANRMLYMVNGTPSGAQHGNAMFPINPGSDTYMYLGRDTSIVDGSDAMKEFYFVPSRLATNMNIHQDDYVTRVGYASSSKPELKDYLETLAGNPVITKIFNGKFTDQDSRGHMKNFAAVRGWMRVRRDKVIFMDTTLQNQFYSTHPVTQLENDLHEEFWRYGIVTAKLVFNANTRELALDKHEDMPWTTRSARSSDMTTSQNAITITNANGAFNADNVCKTPDGGTIGFQNYTVGYYADMVVQKGYTYIFAGSCAGTSLSVALAVNGTLLGTFGTNKTYRYRATDDGVVPITIIHSAAITAETSGGAITLTVQDTAGKTVYNKHVIGNDVDAQLFRIPGVMNFTQYKSCSRFLSNKQLL